MKAKSTTSKAKAEEVSKPEWDLKLYVAGATPNSLAAFRNLKLLCDEHLRGRYRIEVIDLAKDPHLAKGDEILAVPTLVRKLPPPIRKIIGTLSVAERVLVGLDLRSHELAPLLGKGAKHAQ